MIRVRNLTKTFNPGTPRAFEALRGIDLDVAKGETVILKGVSGSGKSTLLAILSAMDKPTGGEVIVEGRPVSKLPDLHASHFRAHGIGFVFQHFNLLEGLSVAENVMVPLIPLGLPYGEIERMCRESMERAHIAHRAHRDVRELSGGEKQRAAIARALVNNPPLILCDEPTANLDRANTLAFIELLKEMKEQGKTILVATHDPVFEEAGIHDRLIHMEEGRFVE
jgi:putative ABC transport system ATP-binding protein